MIFNPVPHRGSFGVNILKMRSCLSVETEKRPKGGLLSQQGWLGNAAVPRAILGPQACDDCMDCTCLSQSQAKGK